MQYYIQKLLGFFFFLTALLKQGFISCGSQRVYGIVHENVTFSVASTVPLNEILWKKQKDKVAEWENSELRAFSPFTNRINLDLVSGDLTIFNLTSSDEDKYEMESPNITGTKTFSLYVLEPLPSPRATCALTNGSIEVLCKISEHYNSHPELTVYSWDCPMEQCKHNSTKVYFKLEDDLPQTIQCTASNPLVNKTSSIVLETCVPNSGHSRNRYMFILSLLGAIIITTCTMLYMRGILKCGRQTDRNSSS
ncbi:lymphocyte function-associated antigen 3 isoform X2 [Saimiri boliviensis]|uniref:lymphocyte function-associated antigen 3 isoform X2 n=1 Tax=Saimiri boliviensis TaxID=27679 RepID=UPI00193E37EF|nr:lymphocyte function-associated antigen 3 isoform X2 [Saimiri boliviensis boliviensis]